MAPGSDDNPWRYKITWNPRNVVLAGKGGAAIYMLHGIYKHIPHHQLFKRLSEIEIPGFGKFESYPNRDSLKYINLYKLKNVETVLRGTLRRPGFCSAWNAFVQLGMTDDSYKVYQVKEMTYNDFTRTYLPYSKLDPKINFANYLHLSPDSSEMEKIEWLGILKHELIGLEEATPAQVMQKLLEEKWKAQPDDEDLIVMQHKLEYEMDGEKHKVISSMAHTGSFETLTGMAQCVGYPLGIAAMGILNGEIEMKGLHIPVEKQIYEPVLEKLKSLGIDFIEEDEVIPVVEE
jgi:saccharopine dehydrogenase-like NADP-dependent oxidoreductase